MCGGAVFFGCSTPIHDSKLDAKKYARNPREVRPRGTYLLQSKLNEAKLTPLGKFVPGGVYLIQGTFLKVFIYGFRQLSPRILTSTGSTFPEGVKFYVLTGMKIPPPHVGPKIGTVRYVRS